MLPAVHALLIDPQNDFMDVPGAALPVPGATMDALRTAKLINVLGDQLVGVTVTLDSHAHVGIERTTFWRKGDGYPVEPFTQILAADVMEGRYVPRLGIRRDSVAAVLKEMEQRGAPLLVWPVHCVVGTPGHNIHPNLVKALQDWSEKTQMAVRTVLKGTNLMAEHFGAFEANPPRPDAPETQFNTELAQYLCDSAHTLVVAGQASSHCVAATMDQFLKHLITARASQLRRIVLLSDCMSPVTGFESRAAAFFDRAEKFFNFNRMSKVHVSIMRSDEFLANR